MISWKYKVVVWGKEEKEQVRVNVEDDACIGSLPVYIPVVQAPNSSLKLQELNALAPSSDYSKPRCGTHQVSLLIPLSSHMF